MRYSSPHLYEDSSIVGFFKNLYGKYRLTGGKLYCGRTKVRPTCACLHQFCKTPAQTPFPGRGFQVGHTDKGVYVLWGFNSVSQGPPQHVTSFLRDHLVGGGTARNYFDIIGAVSINNKTNLPCVAIIDTVSNRLASIYVLTTPTWLHEL